MGGFRVYRVLSLGVRGGGGGRIPRSGFRGAGCCIGAILGLSWVYIGKMEKKKETTS